MGFEFGRKNWKVFFSKKKTPTNKGLGIASRVLKILVRVGGIRFRA